MDILIDEPDFEWLMIDASHVKVHADASGAVGGNQDMERTKGGSTPKSTSPWMHIVCQSEFLLWKIPERIVKDAIHLIKGISAEALLADRGYDTNEILAYVLDTGMDVVIPSKKNRKHPRAYDIYLYRLRHLVENAFLILKRWRGIATRYANLPMPLLLLYRYVVLLFGLLFVPTTNA